MSNEEEKRRQDKNLRRINKSKTEVKRRREIRKAVKKGYNKKNLGK